MRVILRAFPIAVACAACSSAPRATLKGGEPPAPVYYELFKAGDATTDQTAGAPGSHSSLIGTDQTDADVKDTDFAVNVATPALRSGAALYFSLGECFSGGFLDDLAPLGGTQSVLTSARHTETAAYGSPAPDGVDIDFTDAFIRGLADGKVPAERVAAATAALDPFGPNPNAQRINETMGSEHNQYMATGKGADLKPADFAATGIAVLWAGMPAERDGTQMNLMIEHLVQMGYTRDRIYFLYGGGQIEATHPVARAHIVDQTPPVNLRAATKKNLFDLFATVFGGKGVQATKPNFVFFYVGDHGGVDATVEAKRNFTPDLQVVPQIPPRTPGVPAPRLVGAG